MGAFFISYREGETAAIADLIYMDLARRFGPDQVYMWKHSNRAGEVFKERQAREIRECRTVLVLVGPRFAESVASRAGGSDYMRQEVAAGLRLGKAVGVLVDGAQTPAEDRLPEDLRALSGLHMNPVRLGRDFPRDMDLLIADIPAMLLPARRDGPGVVDERERKEPDRGPDREEDVGREIETPLGFDSDSGGESDATGVTERLPVSVPISPRAPQEHRNVVFVTAATVIALGTLAVWIATTKGAVLGAGAGLLLLCALAFRALQRGQPAR